MGSYLGRSNWMSLPVAPLDISIIAQYDNSNPSIISVNAPSLLLAMIPLAVESVVSQAEVLPVTSKPHVAL
jgi:hypothetical protein